MAWEIALSNTVYSSLAPEIKDKALNKEPIARQRLDGVVNQAPQPLSLTDLFQDVVTQISIHFTDVSDLSNLSLANKALHVAMKTPVSDALTWRPFAAEIGCPIDNSSPAREQVISFVKDLMKKASNSFWRRTNGGCYYIPTDIDQILRKPLTPSGIKQIHRWLIARDTLVVWERLARSFSIEWPDFEWPQYYRQVSSQQYIDAAAKFSDIFKQNCTQLNREITWLCLMGYDLTSLPADLEKLQNMDALVLENNLFTSIPEMIHRLPNLCYVNLAGNPLTNRSVPRNSKLNIYFGFIDWIQKIWHRVFF